MDNESSHIQTMNKSKLDKYEQGLFVKFEVLRNKNNVQIYYEMEYIFLVFQFFLKNFPDIFF